MVFTFRDSLKMSQDDPQVAEAGTTGADGIASVVKSSLSSPRGNGSGPTTRRLSSDKCQRLQENHHVGVSERLCTHSHPATREAGDRAISRGASSSRSHITPSLGLYPDPHHSRYRFVRFVFRQDNRTLLSYPRPEVRLLDGRSPEGRICTIRRLNPAYAELERHYGFVADPAKVAMARHKGKVERCVLVRQQILSASMHWCLQE